MASAFSSELTCPICLELFDDPVTLPCMHSYCRECLESILETGGGRHVQCPACRKTESLNKAGLQKLPRNFTLANIVATYRSVDKNPQIPCDLCDEKLQQNAAKSCPECNLSYCINCLIHHPQRGVLAKHSLIEPQEFVSKKKKLVCLKCAVLPGKDSELEACKRDHGSDVMDVETAKITLMSQMQGDYVKLDERHRKYLQDIYKTTETLNNIMQNADTERKELKQKCHEKMEEIISNFKKDFERDLKRISDDYDSGVKEVEDKGQRHLRQLKEASDHLQDVLPDMKKMLQENGKDLDFKELHGLSSRVQKKVEAKEIPACMIVHPNFNIDKKVAEMFLEESKADEGAMASVIYTLESKRAVPQIKILSCACNERKKGEGASVTVTWEFDSYRTTEIKFELKFIEMADKDPTHVIMVRNIGIPLYFFCSSYTVNQLQHNVTYCVTVSVQGKPESESESTIINTLPAVQRPQRCLPTSGPMSFSDRKTPNTHAERKFVDPSKLRLSRQNVEDWSTQPDLGGGASGFAGWGCIRKEDGAQKSQEESSVEDWSVQQGPSGDTRRSAGWGHGSMEYGARNSQERIGHLGGYNRFTGWGHPSTYNYGGALRLPRNSNIRRGGILQAQSLLSRRGSAYPPSSWNIEQGRERALAAVRDFAKGQYRPEWEPMAGFPVVRQLTVDEMEKRTKSIIDEYLHLHDTQEAVLRVEELNSPSTIHAFVSTAFNHVIERSEFARSLTGHLFYDLVKKGTISIDAYIKGLHEILQYAGDLEIDIPRIWQYFGELIGPMIQDGSVPLNFLRQAAEPLKENNKAGNLIAEILLAASHREGQKKVSTLWRQSGLRWDEFVPAGQIQTFLRDRKLEFIEEGRSYIQSIQEKLDDMMGRQNADNEAVFDWIEENCDDKTVKSKKFIRALMTSVCQSAITGSGNNARVVPDEIKRRGVVLTKFFGNQPEFELQALYALQALVHRLEHPPGVLRTFFDNLFDEDIISEDAFNQWEKSTDPAEREGKGVAMKQVCQFFHWLREAEDFSDS